MQWYALGLAGAAVACGRLDFARTSTSPDAASDVAVIDFCATQPAAALCDDFDTTTLGTKWDGQSGAMLSLDANEWTSSPNALAAASPLGAPSGTQAALYRSFPLSFVTGSIELDVRLRSAGDAGTRIVVARVVLGAASVGIGTHENGSEITQETTAGTKILTASSQPLGFTAWRHVRIAIDLGAQTATLFYDGAQVATVALDPGTVSAPPLFQAGLAWIENTSTVWSVDIDNVVFTY